MSESSPPAVPAEPLRLAAQHDRALYARVFQNGGRIHIPGALADADAALLHRALTETRWSVAINGAEGVFDIPEAQFAALGDADRAKFFSAANARGGAGGFQFLYKRLILSDHGEPFAGEPRVLARVVALLNSPAFLDFARAVTGDASIRFADAQATLYEPGHFLTAHDDLHEEKGRRAAFVLSMTKAWRADFGGLLLFLDEDSHVAEGYCPAFNALNIFRVPQMHCVSAVAPFAPRGRFSITGWFRR